MINLKHKLIIAGIAAATATGTVNAANVTATANAFVLEPLTISEDTEMDFGTLAAGAVAGTVVLDTAGARTATGSVQLIAAGAGAAGEFTITGEGNQAYTLSITSTANNLMSGGNTMSTSTFTNNASGTLSGSGSETFEVGATLAVGINQPGGTYAGSYDVSVNYQ